MTMYVLIEEKAEGTYTASLIGWPALEAQGESEAEALARLRQSLTTHIGRGRIVPLDIEVAPTENPWLQLGEHFKDNPLLDEVTESIAEYRSQLDATSDQQ
jgi:predicted RNase H-like HicB family nuclease